MRTREEIVAKIQEIFTNEDTRSGDAAIRALRWALELEDVVYFP